MRIPLKLDTQGCDEMQGYYFRKPLPVAEIWQLLREKRKLALGAVIEL